MAKTLWVAVQCFTINFYYREIATYWTLDELLRSYCQDAKMMRATAKSTAPLNLSTLLYRFYCARQVYLPTFG